MQLILTLVKVVIFLIAFTFKLIAVLFKLAADLLVKGKETAAEQAPMVRAEAEVRASHTAKDFDTKARGFLRLLKSEPEPKPATEDEPLEETA